ncbi:MAG: dihydrofolate reductase family protein [Stappiaceae bacterium]
MRKLAILTFMTLDGVMQAPADPDEDRSGGFKHGGWAMPYWQPVMDQVQVEAMSVPYDLLLGRRTYDIFAPNFSSDSNSPVAEMFNKATKYVVTGNDQGLAWANTSVVQGNLVEQLRALKNGEGPLLQVHGSWELIQLLIEHDLVDEYRLWTFPLMAGSGKRLFQNGNPLYELALSKSKVTTNNVVMNFYERVR